MRFSLTQIQSLVEICRAGFHVSRAAAKLNTSQSAISKHLKSLEDSLSRPLFTRSGKRLSGLTPEGEKILKYAERMLQDADSIEKISVEANTLERETLSLATTPTIAQYLLPETVKAFTHANPDIHLRIQVEESDETIATVRKDACDFAIAPIGKRPVANLSVDFLLEWNRVLIGTANCPLFDTETISLEAIAQEPIIAFETPTVSLRDTFKEHGLDPNYALTTSNPDVMKAYAAQGLGVAIVATPTFDPVRDAPLVARDASHLFPNVKIAAIQKLDRYQSTAQKRFMSYLKSVLNTCS